MYGVVTVLLSNKICMSGYWVKLVFGLEFLEILMIVKSTVCNA